jgi:hypothetical protein
MSKKYQEKSQMKNLKTIINLEKPPEIQNILEISNNDPKNQKTI